MNTENNKIIAKFMGWNNTNLSYLYSKGKDLKTITELKFHSDWNWLIEVVEKIEKSKYFYEINIFYDSVYKENNCLIMPSQKNTFNQIQCNAGTKIEAVYNACIAFIKWYNEQNKF